METIKFTNYKINEENLKIPGIKFSISDIVNTLMDTDNKEIIETNFSNGLPDSVTEFYFNGTTIEDTLLIDEIIKENVNNIIIADVQNPEVDNDDYSVQLDLLRNCKFIEINKYIGDYQHSSIMIYINNPAGHSFVNTIIQISSNLNDNEMLDYIDNELKLTFVKISKQKRLSDDFLRMYKDYVDWKWISRTYKLSEDFIREFQDKVDWVRISRYQILSEDFIREFKDKVDWYNITNNQVLSESFKEEFKDQLYLD